MKKLFLLVAGLLLIALPALGQMPFMRMPKMAGEFKMPAVGAWSEYRIIMADARDTVNLKLSITGKEKCDTLDCFWFEFQSGEFGGASVVKMLVSGDPNNQDNIKRIIIKRTEGSAIELPADLLHRPAPPRPEAEEPVKEGEKAEPASKEPEMTNIGTETITLPAGKLKCIHMQAKEGEQTTDVWTNETVPFFGLAKSTDSKTTLELTGFGATGAKTAITEEPEKMPAPPPPPPAPDH